VWRAGVCKQLDKLRLWLPDWIDKNNVFLQGRRSGLGRDFFALDWGEEQEPVF